MERKGPEGRSKVYLRKGERITIDVQLVKRMVDISKILERPIASPEKAKKIFNLNSLSQ